MNLSSPAAGLKQVYFPEGPECQGRRTKEGGAPCQSSLSRLFFPQSPRPSSTRKKPQTYALVALPLARPSQVGGGGRECGGIETVRYWQGGSPSGLGFGAFCCLPSCTCPAAVLDFYSRRQPDYSRKRAGENRKEGPRERGLWLYE